MKKYMLAYIAPPDLLYTWPELALNAGYHVEVESNPYVVVPPGRPHQPSITCRSGIVARGDLRIRVCPNAGAHPASSSPVAGKLLILIFCSMERCQEGPGPTTVLAHEFGALLTAAGAIYVHHSGINGESGPDEGWQQ